MLNLVIGSSIALALALVALAYFATDFVVHGLLIWWAVVLIYQSLELVKTLLGTLERVEIRAEIIKRSNDDSDDEWSSDEEDLIQKQEPKQEQKQEVYGDRYGDCGWEKDEDFGYYEEEDEINLLGAIEEAVKKSIENQNEIPLEQQDENENEIPLEQQDENQNEIPIEKQNENENPIEKQNENENPIEKQQEILCRLDLISQEQKRLKLEEEERIRQFDLICQEQKAIWLDFTNFVRNLFSNNDLCNLFSNEQ